MHVLRDPAAVLDCLDASSRPYAGGPPRIVMAGAHPVTGTLRGLPLTGAEQQDPNGGLLNMNPPRLTGYRRQLTGWLVLRRGGGVHQARRTCPRERPCHAPGRGADIAAGYAAPFAAALITDTLGAGTQRQLQAWSDVAFGVVRFPDAISEVDAAWAEMYSYFATRRLDGLAAAIGARLTGHTPGQIAYVLATVSNGFGAVPPVLTRVLIELLRQPGTVTACLRGEQFAWRAEVRRLIGTRAMFPVALPRLVMADTWLGGHLAEEGTLVLPWLMASARPGLAPR